LALSEIMKSYLGRMPERKGLAEQIKYYDGRLIDCAILSSDLHGSVAVFRQLHT